MKDRYYVPTTKATHKSVSAYLTKRGYKEDAYGDTPNGNGYCYMVKDNSTLKLTYKWVYKVEPTGYSHYVSGQMISLEDMSGCY